MSKSSHKKIYTGLDISPIISFLAAPIVYPPPLDYASAIQWSEYFSRLFILFIFWYILKRALSFSSYTTDQSIETIKSRITIIRVLSALIGSLGVIYSLHSLSVRLLPGGFYLILLAIFIDLIYEFTKYKRSLLPLLLVAWIKYSLIGAISFTMVSTFLRWQNILFSIALACFPSTLCFLRTLQTTKSTNGTYLRICLVGLTMPLILIGGLVVIGQLEGIFILLWGLLPFITKLATIIPKEGVNIETSKDLYNACYLFPLLFVGLFIFLRMIL